MIALMRITLIPILLQDITTSSITFHGIFMTLFMTMPLLIGGFGNILIPLMPSSSDMIFPRLNALSLRLVIDPLFLMFLAMLLDGGVNAG